MSAAAGRVPSFEKINYSVRPAKATERWMMMEAFGRLATFEPLPEYHYVGFGSTFFIDFKLLHRFYGMEHLTSVEQEVDKKRRFDFNKPFSCVKMHYGTAENFLTTKMKWDKRAIVWLDYDSRLSESMLSDLDRALENCRPGSFICITVDAEPVDPVTSSLREIRKDLDKSRLPAWATTRPASLKGWKLAEAYAHVIRSSIAHTMRTARPGYEWHQVFHFRYRDGARMLTLGGVVVDDTGARLLQQCRFDDLDYHRPDEKAFEIRVPNLTPPEIHHIQRELPNLNATARKRLERLAIEDRDIEDLRLLYRYLPHFVEASA